MAGLDDGTACAAGVAVAPGTMSVVVMRLALAGGWPALSVGAGRLGSASGAAAGAGSVARNGSVAGTIRRGPPGLLCCVAPAGNNNKKKKKEKKKNFVRICRRKKRNCSF